MRQVNKPGPSSEHEQGLYLEEIENGFDDDNIKIDQELVIFSISGDSIQECPHVDVMIGSRKVQTLLDSGAQSCVMNEDLFNKLLDDGIEMPHLPVHNTLLQTDCGAKSRRIKRQALIDFSIDGVMYQVVALIAPNLLTDLIVGVDYLREYKVTMEFAAARFSTCIGQAVHVHSFTGQPGLQVNVGSAHSIDSPLLYVRLHK
jgi:hypothetical protein